MEYSSATFISFLLRIFEVTAEFIILSIFFKRKTKIPFFIFSILIYTFLVTSLKRIVPYSTYWLIPPTLMCLFSLKLFEGKWQKKIALCLALLTVVIVLDSIFAIFTLTLFDFPAFSKIAKNDSLYHICSFLISCILYLLAIIIKHVKLLKFASHTEIHKSAGILINAFATFILIAPNCVILFLYFDDRLLPIWIIFVNVFSLLLINIISIINTNRSIKQAISEERQMYQQNYITTLENLVDGLRTFKHDYSNTLATINGYIQLENWSGLKKFFSQIMDESKAISTLDKLNPNLIKNPTIFGLITAKYQVCLKNNVKMNFEILGTLENLAINEFELSRILGIFLNNAIEAASGSKERKINFLISELKTKTTIEISNSYSSESLKISKTSDLFEKGVSTKGKGRGLGLFKVKQIINKYPCVSLQTISNDNLFLQKLVIPKA